MPKTKLQDFIFTIIMATFMVYGMIFYNITLHTQSFSGKNFLAVFHELPIMVAIAFLLEFFVVGKLARFLAFKIVTPKSKPLAITVAVSTCICMIMCPTMSLIATVFINEDKSFISYINAWAFNLPVALSWQLLVCGPLVRFIFRNGIKVKNKIFA